MAIAHALGHRRNRSCGQFFIADFQAGLDEFTGLSPGDRQGGNSMCPAVGDVLVADHQRAFRGREGGTDCQSNGPWRRCQSKTYRALDQGFDRAIVTSRSESWQSRPDAAAFAEREICRIPGKMERQEGMSSLKRSGTWLVVSGFGIPTEFSWIA